MSQAPDPYRYFRVEAREIVEGLNSGLLALEKGAAVDETAARLLRLAHTLKGAARVVRQNEIAEMAHAVEDALAPLRSAGAAATREQVDAALALVDAITLHLQSLCPAPDGSAPAARDSADLHPLRHDVLDLDTVLDGLAEASVQLQALRQKMAVAERARQLVDLLAGPLSASARQGNASQGLQVRARGVAEELRALLGRLENGLGAGFDALAREVQQVREAAERLRLVPAALLAGPLERTARDTANAAGRDVTFTAATGDVRVDAHVLAAVQGALIQLVRNAVVHGIEPAPERRRLGKPPAGKVSVEALRRGSRVVFRCRDDGRGVDLDALRRLAHDKGLAPAGEAPLGAAHLVRLLLRGGLTTTGTPTEVSGRGVGLDVVRETASRLGGEVAVETRAGEGTTVELEMPVSLSALEALMVEAAGRTAGIPLEAVKRAVRFGADEVVRGAHGAAQLVHDGRTVPFAPLGALLGGRDVPPSPASWTAVIVASGDRIAGVGVDRLLGTASLLVRPVPALAPVHALVAGTCLDSDGNPQLVLDASELVAAAHAVDPRARPPEPARKAPVLVVDDSLTTRMLEQSILESAGFEVEVAVSGEEALDKASKRAFGLFLVDVEMPGMDGFTFVERTRTDPALRDVPSILVTSRSSPEDRRRGEEVGARAYVVKSEFDQAALLETIRRLAR